MRYHDWDGFMAAQRRNGLLSRISEFVTAERARTQVYPPAEDVFKFTMTPLRDVRVVILGQGPYHGPGQAHGLAFSVPVGVAVPPSLKNIFHEYVEDVCRLFRDGDARSDQDFFAAMPYSGDLMPWTRQGVLLLNTALTVRQGEAGSHLDIWQPFTDAVIEAVVTNAEVVPHFIIWGSKAKATFERRVGRRGPGLGDPDWLCRSGRKRTITSTYSPHPSPLFANRGFFGSRPFSRANLALKLNNPGRDVAVDWRLP